MRPEEIKLPIHRLIAFSTKSISFLDLVDRLLKVHIRYHQQNNKHHIWLGGEGCLSFFAHWRIFCLFVCFGLYLDGHKIG